jgi:CDP-4-dehydro-6-deoxyglucose reductase
VLSAPAAEHRCEGGAGFLREAALANFDMSNRQLYVCSAPAMVESTRRDFVARRNLPPEHLFADSFLTQADMHSSVPAKNH